MGSYNLSFEHPACLLLLLLLPVIWLLGRRSLSGLGRMRWWLANGFRSLLLILLVASLAEVQLVRTGDRMTVLFLIDRSLSISRERLGEIIDFVNASAQTERRPSPSDCVGVITFGCDAAIEAAPWEGAVWLPPNLETQIDPEQTNLEAALRLAHAAFPPDSAKRVVIVTDGNETLGEARREAQRLAEDGIGIDVVPIHRRVRAEITVEKIVTPVDSRKGSPFDARVVVQNDPIDKQAGQPVPGKLTIRRVENGRSQVIAEKPVRLEPGKHVYSFREQLEATGFFTYEAAFTPDEAEADEFSQNNRATAFTHVYGSGRVLLIVDWQRADGFNALAEMLRANQIDVVIQTSDQLFTTLPELQAYDAVILADVPRSSGTTADDLRVFSDEQVHLLAENTRRMGCGLIMIGGPESFGAGGWADTEVEAAMPVDFRVKNMKVAAVGALMLVIDCSGSMMGEKLTICKAAAVEAVKVLGPQDYIGVLAFDSTVYRIVPMQKVVDRARITRMISRLANGGGTDMEPGMREGYQALASSSASVKHMIVLTDGQTPPANYQSLVTRMRNQGITVSAVAVGDDADTNLLNMIANTGGGKFYRVRSLQAIPRIFMHEARRVARPLVYENEKGVTPQVTAYHEMITGIDSALPPLTGYVLTTPKENPLVEIPIAAPLPAGQENPVLAAWQYGSGRSVALTTDTGQRWANAWTSWPGQEKMLTQLVRWAMRPTQDSARFLIATDVDGRQVKLVLTATDEEGVLLNFLQPTVMVLGPGAQAVETSLEQESPGRYVGQFDAPAPGSYFIAVTPKQGGAPIRLGVNVGYSEEFRHREDNLVMLSGLAALQPRGGRPGRVIEMPPPKEVAQAPVQEIDPFRHDLLRAASRQPAWHLLLLVAGGLLLVDVANRRVAWQPGWAWRWLVKLLRRRSDVIEATVLGRLQAKKEEVRRQWESTRGEKRWYAPDPLEEDQPLPTILTGGMPEGEDRPAPVERPAMKPAETEESTYFERLLRAKRKAGRDDPS